MFDYSLAHFRSPKTAENEAKTIACQICDGMKVRLCLWWYISPSNIRLSMFIHLIWFIMILSRRYIQWFLTLHNAKIWAEYPYFFQKSTYGKNYGLWYCRHPKTWLDSAKRCKSYTSGMRGRSTHYTHIDIMWNHWIHGTGSICMQSTRPSGGQLGRRCHSISDVNALRRLSIGGRLKIFPGLQETQCHTFQRNGNLTPPLSK